MNKSQALWKYQKIPGSSDVPLKGYTNKSKDQQASPRIKGEIKKGKLEFETERQALHFLTVGCMMWRSW